MTRLSPLAAAALLLLLPVPAAAPPAAPAAAPACEQPIAPLFSTPRPAAALEGPTALVNHTHGPYLLLLPAAAAEEELPGGDDGSWSGAGPQEEWAVPVYCRAVPGRRLGSVRLRRVAPGVAAVDAAEGLARGALVAADGERLRAFSWGAVAACLPPASCGAGGDHGDPYALESELSKFVAVVAVMTIAVTSVMFLVVTMARQPCWGESKFDEQLWQSRIDLDLDEALQHVDLSPRQPPGGEADGAWAVEPASLLSQGCTDEYTVTRLYNGAPVDRGQQPRAPPRPATTSRMPSGLSAAV